VLIRNKVATPESLILMLVVPLENGKETQDLSKALCLKSFCRNPTNFLKYDYLQLFGTDVD